MARQGGFYVVRKGRETGIFNTWSECKNQVNGYSGAVYKKFDDYEQAKSFLGHKNSASNHRSSELTGSLISKPHTTQKRSQGNNLPPSLYSSLTTLSKFSSPTSVDKITFYSVKSNVPNVESKIFDNWKDCQAYVKHKRGITFKKFDNRSAAEDFINGVSAHDYKLINIPRDIFQTKYKLAFEWC